MNHFVRGWAKAFVLIWASAALAVEPATDLAKIDHFAFGGIGVVGSTSAGELAFRKVMAATAPRESFLRLLESGNLQAKCYALVGLKLVDAPGFEANAGRFNESKEIVQTIAGCMMMKEPMRTVVAHIRKGEYDEVAMHPRPKPER